ncbi:MAG: hypothetical protein OXE46_04610 [Chloroflexi bacterium]|nr:hypothetical protein [Chloroflexota bacterium]
MHAETIALLRITLAVALLLATAAGGTGERQELVHIRRASP